MLIQIECISPTLRVSLTQEDRNVIIKWISLLINFLLVSNTTMCATKVTKINDKLNLDEDFSPCI